MTVIREKQNFKYPKPNSNANSDTESIQFDSVSPSDTESLNEELSANRIHRPPPVRISHVEDLVDVKKSSGKKKLRRYRNKCVLHTLNEEEDNGNFIIIMDSYKSPFARLLEDPNSLQYWNNFIEKSEEEQSEIIREFSEKYIHLQSTNNSNNHGRLSSRIRRIIKIKKNLSLEAVRELEIDLIEFFKATPDDTYIKFPGTSFDRLLLHGVAQYHRLKSLSILSEDVGKRLVKVLNTQTNWTPADCFLADFIKELRQ